MMRSKRGAGLLEVMFGLFMIGIAGIVFSTSFPPAFRTLSQASENTNAALLAQKKMEQIRGLDYASLTYANLTSSGILDSLPGPSGYTFTIVDSVATTLPSGAGTMTITTESGALKRVVVSVDWTAVNQVQRNLTVTTLVADTTPWVN
ncbi:MAG: hypothetical protein Q7T82_19810 [Armatimonadota bacterium]|nr:hypothetical protein [Armatimonadota bacterium]